MQDEEKPITREEAKVILARVQFPEPWYATKRQEERAREDDRRELLRRQAAELGEEGT